MSERMVEPEAIEPSTSGNNDTYHILTITGNEKRGEGQGVKAPRTVD